jgi:hypothetical protein
MQSVVSWSPDGHCSALGQSDKTNCAPMVCCQIKNITRSLDMRLIWKRSEPMPRSARWSAFGEGPKKSGRRRAGDSREGER